MAVGQQKTVLMADDDAEDCFLAVEAFAETGAEAAFRCVLDGVELMDHLSEHSRSQVKRLPDLILLDLNTPRKDGRETLIEIKAEPALIPNAHRGYVTWYSASRYDLER